MKTTSMSVDDYHGLNKQSRVGYLDQQVKESSTDLTENFVISALSAERDPLAKWFLVKASGLLRSVSAVPLLIRLCEEPDVDFEDTSLHAICAWSLGKIGQPALQPVLDLMRASDVETRRSAVDALGELRDIRAIDVLCRALQHDEHQVQLWAGLSLAKLGSAALSCLEGVAANTRGSTHEIAVDAIRKIRNHSLSSAN